MIKKPYPFIFTNDANYSTLQNTTGSLISATVYGGKLHYYPHFFTHTQSDEYLDYFLENSLGYWKSIQWKDHTNHQHIKASFSHINWRQEHVTLFGKTHPLPRLTAWYGDTNAIYRYSGITSHPHPWDKQLFLIKQQIEQTAHYAFNSVLMNWYRDGSDTVGWHADNESSLGKQPVIASISLGETRDFILRKNTDPSDHILIALEHGSLLLMTGGIQQHWQHSIPKRKNCNQSRINLTFRKIIQQA
ncbi:MAG: alpha-ketoglutarate-dependent dioxygenase AlkB [Cellvibrionales bacterium]|nr:alpha-ketoglutarate-dependent dioxygenase AlkB [Cellvibrionales bacterium]